MVYTFGDPDKICKKYDQDWLISIRAHPGARVITVAYTSLINKERFNLTSSSFARNAVWIKVKDFPQLGFDQNDILGKTLDHLKQKIYIDPLGRRKPYFLAGTMLCCSAIVMLPNSTAWFSGKSALLLGTFFLALMDASTNVAMQPFRALVADNLSDEQRETDKNEAPIAWENVV